MLGSGLWLVDKISEQSFVAEGDRELIAMVYVCLVIVGFNLFYNTLLINARFFCKMKSVTCGLFFFDCLNNIGCYCILGKFCKGNNYIGFVIRQIFQAALMIYTVTLVYEKQDQWELEFEVGLMVRGTTRFEIYLIIYMCHWFIFQIAKPIFFCLVSVFTCCCDCWDEELPSDFNFDAQIWSYEFVEYQLKGLNNFENHPRGRGEL